MNLPLLLLTLCQGLYLTNNVTFIAINGVVGLALAPAPWLATLPVMAYVAGSALSAPLVARHQRRFGRRRTFQLGLVVAMFTAALCALAVLTRQFWLLIASTLAAGYYNANGSLYRFAAVELVHPSAKERAISWVLAGGILGAVAGPQLALLTRDALPQPFAGAYVALIGVALVSLLLISRIGFPALPAGEPGKADGRPLAVLARQQVFVVAVAVSALGYGVMNLLMAATPIAMAQHAHSFGHAALVLEWHVLGMYVPGFFTGWLIKRFGALWVMAIGLLLNLACAAVALSGVDLMHFLVSLLVLGIGWNFLFIGGTALFTEAYQPEEKTRAQAAMDTTIYATMTISSFGSGALVTTGGWTWMNVAMLLPLALVAVALGWLALERRRSARAPAPPRAW
ncbi:MFS transporter [Archangium minus]|uniref:MFS transporter n=1 Tax=Archangium minus TaxID=83450 RepID=A0ABY9X4P0_9BACT|nr:MFS transporter [Archangium minus]